MSIKQAIEALEVAQEALDISQSLQESAKSNHHPKTLAAYERVSAAIAALRSMPAEPVAYSVTCNGNHVKNVFAEWEHAHEKMLNLNMHYPQDKRAVVPLFATPHTEAVRMSDQEIDAITDQQWRDKSDTPIYAAYRSYARAIEQAIGRASRGAK